METVYPVPQKDLYVSAGMNVLNPEGHCPKATDVSPWYGVYHFLGEESLRDVVNGPLPYGLNDLDDLNFFNCSKRSNNSR